MKYLPFLLCLIALPAHATDVVRVIDGDTIVIAGGERIRLGGIDTPELRGKCPYEKLLARDARRRLEQLLDGSVDLRNSRRGKYRRVADAFKDGANVANVLIKEGLGRLYHGGKREGWCR